MNDWFSVGEWTLLDPPFLLLVPMALLVLLWRLWRPRAALPSASTALLADLPQSLRARFVQAPAVFKLLCVCCLAVAMARPVTRDVLPLREEGVDILLVVDISSSMTMRDMERTRKLMRVDAARDRAAAFAAARVTDRVGLLTFARFPELCCPLTLDEIALGAFLDRVEPVPQDSGLDGTAIGVALAKAADVLEDSAAKSKVVVLLTDGVTTMKDIDPLEGARLCVDADIRVHTIGLGNGVPGLGGMRPLDFAELKEIAKITGGEFFAARSDADLAAVYAKIDELEKVELEDPRYRTIDGFQLPMLIGLLLLAVALLLEFLWIREAP